MTQTNAERAANLLMGAAVAGAAYYVLKTPSLRRVAWRLAVTTLTATLPVWFRNEIAQGWRESGRTPDIDQTVEQAGAAPAV
jgi:hypothetical protein